MEISPTVNKFGLWSAALASVFSIIYIIGQLAEWFNQMGSEGGPENASTALGIIVLLIPSFFLAPSFALLILSVHY